MELMLRVMWTWMNAMGHMRVALGTLELCALTHLGRSTVGHALQVLTSKCTFFNYLEGIS